MRRNILAAFIGLASLVAFAFCFIEKVDDGFIIVVGQHVVDPIGEMHVAVTRISRDCTRVLRRPTNSPLVESLKKFIDGETADEKSIPRAAWTSGDWILIESDFVNREPAIILLRHDGKSQYLVTATYGGTAAPFNDVQAIHEYFRKSAPAAPAQLLYCYEPVGAPFNSAFE
ncbi:hypothetical protein GM658_14270 [Pseudoduganella eburnea]|uniref:Uncharacterized protein n=1 Tax=Massilia eburnea TaxID=1776165 RepID=A0A6L6QGZ4_9BURK|nr:hypothetical protein [Massilia eburnea]MTW11768.1 hypothetical protein [Massilia eburnea]